MGEFLERDSSASTAGPGPGAGAPKAPERHHRSEETSSLHPKHATSYSSSSCGSSSKDKRASKTAAAATTSSDLNADRFQHHSPGGVAGTNNAAPPVQCAAAASGNKERSPVVGNPVLENDIKEIKRLLKSYMGRLENKDVSAKAAKEWRLVARVLDRLFFYTYIATIVISWCTFFPRDVGSASSPHPTKSSTGEPLKEQQLC